MANLHHVHTRPLADFTTAAIRRLSLSAMHMQEEMNDVKAQCSSYLKGACLKTARTPSRCAKWQYGPMFMLNPPPKIAKARVDVRSSFLARMGSTACSCVHGPSNIWDFQFRVGKPMIYQQAGLPSCGIACHSSWAKSLPGCHCTCAVDRCRHSQGSLSSTLQARTERA